MSNDLKYPFAQTGERLSGRIDKVVELNNELYVVDTKTTKTGLTSYYFANFTPNNQVYAYLWAAKHILKLPVVGFIVEAAQTGANFTRFERAVFKVNDEVIEEWYIDAMHKIDLSNMYAKGIIIILLTLLLVLTMVAVSLETYVMKHHHAEQL